MNSIKFNVMLCFTALAFVSISFAQEKNEMYQMYSVHEDHVKPSMVMQYEKTAKGLADKMKEHNIQGKGWLATNTSDFRYLYVSPIKNLSDINNNMSMTQLWEKIGQEDMNELMSGFDKCYDRHGDYIITMDKELTYMPEGINQSPEGKNYRKFYYIYYAPHNGSKMREAMMEVKNLFAKKGSKSYYRVYQSGFGTMDSFYLVAIAAKDALTSAQIASENDKLLGEDAGPIFQKVIGMALRMEEYTGAVRPDLGYKPKTN